MNDYQNTGDLSNICGNTLISLQVAFKYHVPRHVHNHIYSIGKLDINASFSTAGKQKMTAKSRIALITLTIVLLSWFVVLPVTAQGETPAASTADAVLVQFDARTSEAERTAAIESMGGTLVEWLAPIKVARVQVTGKTMSAATTNSVDKSAQVAALLTSALNSSYVVKAEIEGTVQATFSPNDPYYSNTSFVYSPQMINAPGAWDFTLGNPSVVIAILDTGVNANHPEFAGRVLPGYDFINSDTDPDDDNGHGTHVAGTAAAGTNNGIGNVGICGGCSILPVKVLSNTGAGLWSQVANGIIYAADNGADVINLSLGGYSPSSTMLTAVEYAQQKGVLIIGAAGNDNRNDNFYPAAFPNVIGVSATTRNDTRWALSNFGDYIDVAAPGDTIFNTFNDLHNYYGGYAFYSGTSMAAPHVAGLAGLLFSQNQNRTAMQVSYLITSTAKDLGTLGWDALFGWGRIDAGKALAQDATPTGLLRGMAWLDINGNGLLDVYEDGGVGQIAVWVTNTATNQVYTVNTTSSGQWSVGELPAGNYFVQIAVPTGTYFTTTATSINTTLTNGEQKSGLNFGLTSTLPVTSISNFQVMRDADHVIVEWIITRNEVQSMTIERSTQINGPFTNVGEMLTQVVGTNTMIRVTDQLPAELADATLYYQLRVQPTNLVVGPMISMGASGTHKIFLPMVVR